MKVHYVDLTTFKIVFDKKTAIELYKQGSDIAVFNENCKKMCEWKHKSKKKGNEIYEI